MTPLFLNHVSPAAIPREFVFSQEPSFRTWDDDRDLLDRIIVSYQRTIASAPAEVRTSFADRLWTDNGYLGYQAGLIAALQAGDSHRLHDLLRCMFVSDAVHALGMGKAEADILRSKPEHLRTYGIQWTDRLVSLSYAVGAMPVRYPEYDPKAYSESLIVDIEEVAQLVEKRLQICLKFPEIGGVFGGKLGGLPFPMHSFVLLAAAFQVSLLDPSVDSLVIEIGGGFGGLAYWVYHLTPCRYRIYDLSYVLALQGYFLGRAIGPDRITLFGESVRTGPGVSLHPGWDLLQNPPSRVESVISQDSLPEVPPEIALAYLKVLGPALNGSLLSINHEASAHRDGGRILVSVPELISQVGGFRLCQRSPFLLREGFIQELYQCNLLTKSMK